jgi:predicted permease
MGMTLKKGRLYTDAENRREGYHVLVINEELARRYFPNQSAIGKQIELGLPFNEPLSPSDTLGIRGEIVGIVGDVKQRGLAADAFPAVYLPYNELPGTYNSIVVRTSAPAAVVETAIRGRVREIDPHLPVVSMSTMSSVVADSIAQPRFYMNMLATFAGIALLLAAIGIYGVISFTVAQRTRDIGIRIALGATNRRVLAHVVREGLGLAVAGVGIGIVAAFGLTRMISSMLFGVGAVDGATFGTVAAVLMIVALLASWVPARRAARVDPLIAMRGE